MMTFVSNRIIVPASSSAVAPTESSGHSSSFGSPSEPPLLFVFLAVQRDALALARIQALFVRTRTHRLAPRQEAPPASCCLQLESRWDHPTLDSARQTTRRLPPRKASRQRGCWYRASVSSEDFMRWLVASPACAAALRVPP